MRPRQTRTVFSVFKVRKIWGKGRVAVECSVLSEVREVLCVFCGKRQGEGSRVDLKSSVVATNTNT